MKNSLDMFLRQHGTLESTRPNLGIYVTDVVFRPVHWSPSAARPAIHWYTLRVRGGAGRGRGGVAADLRLYFRCVDEVDYG